ncbi:MAG: hypothetical protein WCP39_02450 [Chlamydiota bacterium]
MSIKGIQQNKELPYILSPMDVSILKKGWEKLGPNTASNPWVQTACKILRIAAVISLSFLWVPLYAFGLTVGNVGVFVKNEQTHENNEKIIKDRDLKITQRKLHLKTIAKTTGKGMVLVGLVIGVSLLEKGNIGLLTDVTTHGLNGTCPASL